MKKIDNCENSTVLVGLLLAGILLVMGGYRIFSYLCDRGAVDTATYLLGAAALLCWLFSVAAYATGRGDVAGAVESTWAAASGQIKTVVNNVVFPAIDMILAIFFFVKLGTAYFDYRKTGQFEWTAPAILFACLVFTLTAPLYIWDIVGV